jgi:hypothetical protein
MWGGADGRIWRSDGLLSWFLRERGVGLSMRRSESGCGWVMADDRIKEALRKEFARLAEDFMARLQRIEQAIGALRGSLPVRLDVGRTDGRIKRRHCCAWPPGCRSCAESCPLRYRR